MAIFGRQQGFTPQQISGLLFYFDSRVGVILSGSTVVQWTDLSGNGFHATQSNVTLQPTYSGSGGGNNQPYLGLSAPGSQIALSCSAQNLAVPAHSTVDMFFVVNPVTGSGNAIVCELQTTFNAEVFATYVQSNVSQVDQYSQGNGANIAIVPNVDQIWENCFSGGQSYLAVNNGTQVTGSVAGTTQPAVGLCLFNGRNAGSPFRGNVYAILAYNRQLLPAEAQVLTRYFGNAFNITVP